MADPQFNVSPPIDIIFGSAVCDLIDLRKPLLTSFKGSPNAKFTTLGWVFSGSITSSDRRRVRFRSDVRDPCTCSKEYMERYIACSQGRFSSNSQVLNSSSPVKTDLASPPSVPPAPSPKPQRTNPTRRPFQSKAQTVPLTIVPVRADRDRDLFNGSVEGAQLPVIKLSVQPALVHLCNSKDLVQKPVLSDPQLALLLPNMFALESVPESRPLSPDEFKSCVRSEDDRFSVALPFKSDPGVLGSSRMTAMSRLFALETRHKKSPHLRAPYEAFMRDYIEADHMEIAPPLRSNQPHYYIPHHAVHRLGDPPDKIRVVFNASQTSSSGVSLNQLLLPGPRLQLDIWLVVTRFCFDRFVFVADIRQMFRQILHPPEDRNFLRILWRFDQASLVLNYRLTTITYGTTSAPFLAGRVLQELSQIGERSHPEASAILKTRTYVDDVNGGGPTVQQAIKVRDQLADLLAQARIELRKWASNDPQLLTNIPIDHRSPAATSVLLEEDDSGLKLLGLCWDPVRDVFYFRIQRMLRVTSKRQLASQIAKIFDSLDWLMPVTVHARVIFRSVCQASYEWDDRLPTSTQADWSALAVQLPGLGELAIPRFLDPHPTEVSLIGFADASERAYATAVYSVYYHNSSVQVRLIMSKARMAPVKVVTLPRLELCAAHLLAKTLNMVTPLIPNLRSDRIFAFSDSTIALSWITADPVPFWKVFVGNRVADIVGRIPKVRWFYVSSSENPADCASRGLLPNQLIDHPLWWSGPNWLKAPISSWPLVQVRPKLSEPSVAEEIRSHNYQSAVICAGYDPDLFEDRYSSLIRLQRVVA